MKVGVLALQGAIEEHVAMAEKAMRNLHLKGEVLQVKKLSQMDALDALIIPGGESTVMGKLGTGKKLIAKIKDLHKKGVQIFGTCAGLIILCKDIFDAKLGQTKQPTLGLLDVTVKRNAFGRQKESFEEDLVFSGIGSTKFRGIFIRAPAIEKVSSGVKALAKLKDSVVAVEQGNILATAFHPELTDDTRLHEYFLRKVAK